VKVCSTVSAEAKEKTRIAEANANQNAKSFMLLKWQTERNSKIEAFL